MHHPSSSQSAAYRFAPRNEDTLLYIDPRHPVIPSEVWCLFFKKAGGKQIFAQTM